MQARTCFRLIGICLGLLIVFSSSRLLAADATGTWKWSFTFNDQTRDVTLKLKQDGEKLTGTISGRNQDTEISDGKVAEGNVSFTVTREFNNQKFVQKYTGKLDGDTIKGKIETEINGETRSRDWEAKRAATAAAGGVAGTWKWSRARNDGTSMDFVLNLKQDGERLTGGMKVGEGQETAIEDGKISGKDVSFTVTRERNGNKFVSKYAGTLDGDTIKGKITGNFGGQDRTFDWEAKRAKE